MDSNTSSEHLIPPNNGEIPLPRTVRFWLLLLFEIPSLICSFFVICNLTIDRTLRRSLRHHTILAMNIFAILFKSIDVPLYLNFLIYGTVWLQVPSTCLIWWVADLGCYDACCALVAWTSIERHIFVFYHRWLSTNVKRFFVHYLPLILINVYMIAYYVWMLFFPPCENTYDYTSPVCTATPCFLNHPISGTWEAGVHGCFFTFVIAIFSATFLIRVLLERHRRFHAINWRRHRKMTIQLLSISSIFLVFNLPLNIAAIIQLCGLPFELGAILMPYFFFLTYWVMFLVPFVCLTSLPKLAERLKRFLTLSHRRQATVGVAVTVRPINRRTHQ